MATSEITPELLKPLLPERPRDGHKGTFGHLFAIAGSRGFTGAAKLMGEAAGRSGVGLVTLGVPASLGDVVAGDLREVMTMLLPATPAESIATEAVDAAVAYSEGKTAVALGPGLSQHPETVAFVLAFVERCPVPMVNDADGLNALSTDVSVLTRAAQPCVLTPHPGEMARLCGVSTSDVQAERAGAASGLAEGYGCVVVLKGADTVVAGPAGERFVNRTGNSGMATGGTGDVLTGVIGGLMAQGMSGLDAACAGVFLHGLAGDRAAEAHSERGLIASDVIAALPDAWRALERI